MAVQTILDEIADRQGWNEVTMIELLVEYIDRQGSDEAFADYLNGIAAEESPACPLCGGPMTVVDVEAAPFCEADCQG